MPTPEEEYRTIPLTRGQAAIVDAVDYQRLMTRKWSARLDKHTGTFYALGAIVHSNGVHETLLMHREILGLKKGDKRQGDHRNHDTLDNRRANLRIASHSENARNRPKHACNDGLKGVSKRKDRYQAHIRVNGKLIHLGTRDTAEAAYALYCEAAIRLHGEFAHL